MIHYRSFKEQVRQILDKRGWYQSDLAEAMGVTEGRVSAIFRGDEAVTKRTVEQVAEALKVDPSAFDLYIRYRLFELGTSVPGLIDLGRSLCNAKNTQQLMRIASKIAS